MTSLSMTPAPPAQPDTTIASANNQTTISEAEQKNHPILHIVQGDEHGFLATVENGTIQDRDDHLVIINKNGMESLYLRSTIYLKDGMNAQVRYNLNGNQIEATYDRIVPKDQVVIP